MKRCYDGRYDHIHTGAGTILIVLMLAAIGIMIAGHAVEEQNIRAAPAWVRVACAEMQRKGMQLNMRQCILAAHKEGIY